MASSEVAICNAALSKLGADPIVSLTENNERARTMQLRYAAVRDAEIHRRRWKFSVKRASLPALTSTPASDFDFQYQLPVDYLRLIEGGDIVDYHDLTDFRGSPSAPLYSIEGGLLLTNLGAPINIRYIARIVDTSLFNPSFDEALASRLADECCERITQSDSKRELAMRDYRRAIREAVRANAIESPPAYPADSEWVMARLG